MLTDFAGCALEDRGKDQVMEVDVGGCLLLAGFSTTELWWFVTGVG